ncbi:MAG TPA: hypothetical protein VJM46_01225 [Candidatus Saccharimonadales bacterium]|nr:hypothetical protein [Candidatus Saccharimonadales bacterium]
MTDQTPWHSYRTARPQRFMTTLSGTSFITAVGRLGGGGALCQGTTQGLAVGMKTEVGRGAPRRVPTYTVRLPRWTENVMPEVCLHPLALPHLFVSEQVARGDLMGLLTDETLASTQTTLVDRDPRDTSMLQDYFGAMLGRRRFRITLQTDFDVSVRRARS